MKELFCDICGSEISDKKQSAIYNKSRFKLRYAPAHKHCYESRRKKERFALSKDYFDRLDSWRIFWTIAIMILISALVLWKSFTAGYSSGNLLPTLIMILLALAFISLSGFLIYKRTRFLIRYRI